jgi:ABC-type phosphate transport system auxiliary subunit
LHVIFRGGVLEPEGTVEIKFRFKDLSKVMERLDPKCIQLNQQMSCPELNKLERCKLEKKMSEHEEELKPLYRQVAVAFADLHDTPGRMQEKGVITVGHIS